MALLALVVGAALGAALAAVTKDDESSSGVAPAAALSPPVTTESTATTATTATTAPGATEPQVQVLSSVLTPAGSAAGRARSRARLTVRLRIVNRSDAPISVKDAALVVDGQTLAPDANAAKTSKSVAALLEPIAGKDSTSGVLRFETAGEDTTRLTDDQSAKLRILGQTRSLKIKVGEPAAPRG